METINAIIIDDELDAINVLQGMLTEFCENVNVIQTSQSGIEGIRLIKTHQPNLVFLDIEMPEISGFEVLELLKNRNFKLIFVTAYDEYAIKAIRQKADDYLLKPINPVELEKAIETVRNDLHKYTPKQPENTPEINKIALPVEYGFKYVALNQIEYLQASGSYTYVHLIDKTKIIVCKNLKSFENKLNSNHFLRIRRSYIINVQHISKASRSDGGYVELKNGAIIYLPGRKKENLLEMLSKHFISLD